MSMLRHSLSAFFIGAAAAMVLLGTLYFGSLRPTYSHVANTISELGETGAPQAHLVAYGFFVPVGLLVWLGLWVTHGHTASRDTGLVLFALSGLGIGYTLGALFPCDPGAPLFGSWRTLAHNVAGAIDYGGTVVGFCLFSRYCAWHKASPLAVVFGMAALMMFFGSVALALPAAFSVRGAVQRGMELVQFTGVFFVCRVFSTEAAANQRPAPDAGTRVSSRFGRRLPGQ